MNRQQRAISLTRFPGRPKYAPKALGHLKLEIDDRERRAIERSLAEHRSRLIENVEDTTLTPARRRASLRELSVIASVLRKLRSPSRRVQSTQAAKA
jgi:hypothetical protein